MEEKSKVQSKNVNNQNDKLVKKKFEKEFNAISRELFS